MDREFGEGERWPRRAARALEADDAPGIRLRLHLVTWTRSPSAAAPIIEKYTGVLAAGLSYTSASGRWVLAVSVLGSGIAALDATVVSITPGSGSFLGCAARVIPVSSGLRNS